MILEGTSFESAGDGLAFAIASRIAGEIGARVTADTCDGTHFDGISVSGLGGLDIGYDEPANEHAVLAAGGAAMAQWSYQPGPVLLTTPYSNVTLGVAMPMLALARRLGWWPHDSVSALDALLTLQSGAYSYGTERPPDRWSESPRGQHPSYGLYETRDGWVFIGALSMSLALKLFECLDLTPDLDAEILSGMFDKRSPARARIAALLSARAATFTSQDILARLSRAGVPAANAATLDEAQETPLWKQLERGPLVTVTPRPAGGAVIRDRSDRPLRVVEIAGYISGPFVGRLLCNFGADVTKVEPLDGDPLRRQSLSFAAWNHGKRAIAADLTTPAGQVRVRELIREADIVVTNYLRRTLQHLGLADDAIFALNPGAILVKVGGFPDGSGMENTAAFDPAIQATFGLMRLQGGNEEPVKPQIAASDYIAAILATTGTLAALTRRAADPGAGGFVVQTSLAAAGYLLAHSNAGSSRMEGGTDFKGRDAVPSLYECRDGWLAACESESGAPLTRAALAASLQGKTVVEGIANLRGLGVRATACLHPDDLPEHPAYQRANLFHEITDESGAPVITPRVFGARPPDVSTPRLG